MKPPRYLVADIDTGRIFDHCHTRREAVERRIERADFHATPIVEWIVVDTEALDYDELSWWE